jgi:hypothetical protein
MGRPSPYRRTIESPMKPSARSFTVEIKRSKRRPLHFNALSLPSSRLGDHSLQKHVARDTPPDDTNRAVAPAATLSEAALVFGRLVAPMSVASPTLTGFDPPYNALKSTRSNEGRVLADLLSVAREEERVREAQMLSDDRRRQRGSRTTPRAETTQPETGQTEAHSRPRPVGQPPVGVETHRKVVAAAAEVAGVVAVQPATDTDRAPRSAKPHGASNGSTGRRLRRGGKRADKPIRLKAGERWKRRLPLVCR